jgi:modulator of FtsH protease
VESGYAPTDWVALCAAEVAAAAALTGLVFVSVSINLERIMRYPTLPDRALEAILLFSVVVLTSMLVLVPGQSITLLGAELLLVSVLSWAAVAYIHLRSLTDPGARGYIPQRIAYAVLTELAMLAFALSGLTLVVHAGGGLYWLVPATILALTGAVLSAWVLLVEIIR